LAIHRRDDLEKSGTHFGEISLPVAELGATTIEYVFKSPVRERFANLSKEGLKALGRKWRQRNLARLRNEGHGEGFETGFHCG